MFVRVQIKNTTNQTTIALSDKPGDVPIKIESLLSEMIAGMDVNFSFTSVADFAMTQHVALFTLADVDIVHQVFKMRFSASFVFCRDDVLRSFVVSQQWLAEPLNYALREALSARFAVCLSNLFCCD